MFPCLVFLCSVTVLLIITKNSIQIVSKLNINLNDLALILSAQMVISLTVNKLIKLIFICQKKKYFVPQN